MKKDYFFHLLLLLLLWGWLSGCSSNKTNQAENRHSLPDSMNPHPKNIDTDSISVIEVVETDTIQREEPTSNEESLEEKHTQKIKSIIDQYCQYLNNKQYLDIEQLFANQVDQYITMKNTTAKHIAEEANRFLSTKLNVHYSEGYDEFIIEGNRVIVPMSISWKGYQTKVLAEIRLNHQYKIISYKELKVLPHSGNSQIKINTIQYPQEGCVKVDIITDAPNEAIKQTVNQKVMEFLFAKDYQEKGYTMNNLQELVEKQSKEICKDEASGMLPAAKTVIIKEVIENILKLDCYHAYTHSNRAWRAYNIRYFDVTTSKQINAKDMFISGYQKPLLAMATHIIRAKYKLKKDNPIFLAIPGEFLSKDQTQITSLPYTFYLSPVGITLHYYNIYGGNMGNTQLMIPFTKIKHLIAPDGPLGQLLQYF